MAGNDRRPQAGRNLDCRGARCHGARGLVALGLVAFSCVLRAAGAAAAVPPAAGDLYLAPFAGAQMAQDGTTIYGPAVGTALGYAVADNVAIEPEVVFGHLSDDVGVFVTATANLLYYVAVGSRVTPYFGGGLGVANADGTDLFMHIAGGVDLLALGESATLRLDARVGFLTIDESNTTFRPGVFVVLPLH